MLLANVTSLLIIFCLMLIAAFYQFSSRIWTLFIGIPLMLLTLLGDLSWGLSFVLWVLFIPIALFVNMHITRQRYVIQPLLQILQKQMPKISATEREAIEAGDTWWEKDLFCGRPQWSELLNHPRPLLTLEEENFLGNQVEQLCSMLNDWQIVHVDQDLPPEVWGYLKKERFFGMIIPKEYGGLGYSALLHSTVITKVATASISAAVTTMVPNSLGPGELLVRYGTDEQKKYYLPRLAKGQEIPCFALTAPEAGSDAGAIPDTGLVCKGQHEGSEVVGIRLNWDKRYITLAPVATLVGLAVHLYDPEHLLSDQEDVGITLCLIPATHPGVECGHRHLPMGLAFMNGPTRGKDVFIPLDWIIGGKEMAGHGWRMLMESLSIGRSISLPALSTACGKYAYRVTGAYACVRRQFNISIANFEGIEEMLSQIAGLTYMLESCRMMTAGAVDEHINPSTVSAMAKYHMTETLRTIITHAMDIHAGHAIQAGPRNLLMNGHLATPISITVEGANILTRNLIIFGQGAIRCHPYLLKEIALFSAANPSIQEIDQVLMAHAGFFAGNFLRNLAYGLTGGKMIFIVGNDKRINKYMRQLTRMSAALALLADTSLILLGGSLKRRERISARLGDILSQLYLASTILKYYHDNNKPVADIDYVCWGLQHCLHKIQIACDELANNFPLRWLSKILNRMIFPWGRAYAAPNDMLSKRILTAMLAPSELRDRLTKYMYINDQNNNSVARLEKAFAQVETVDPLFKKLTKAGISHEFNFTARVQAAVKLNILSASEARLLQEYERLKDEIIKVNEFSFDLQTVIA